jgi:hypothetical protein
VWEKLPDDRIIDNLFFKGASLVIKISPRDCEGESWACISGHSGDLTGHLAGICREIAKDVRGILEEHRFEIRE